MPIGSLIARIMWKTVRYVFLIAVSSVAGAVLGAIVGGIAGSIFGDSSWTVQASWQTHGRCAGWTLFAVIAAVGAPFGVVSFCNEPPSMERDETTPAEGPAVGGIRALFAGAFVGACIGLILGFLFCTYALFLYFFAVLSPFGPQGWWPNLPKELTQSPAIPITCLVVVGTLVVLGTVLGPLGTTRIGKTRFRFFHEWD